MKRIGISLVVLIFCAYILNIQFSFADDFYEGEYQGSIQVFATEEVPTIAKPPRIEAGAAIVVDLDSGRVLYEKSGYSKRAIASTTKIMTAILALEKGNLEDEVTISKRAAGVGGSSINLVAGEKVKFKELLYGLLMNSGNDAAIAIAEHIGGTVENFVDMMNAKAKELGANNTNFKSPHGLDFPDHYSTPYDLAFLTRYALRIPEFSKIVGTVQAKFAKRQFYNTNELLNFYPGADGVKTGYTGQAGRCLVASATRDNWRIISVVLNCATRDKRALSSKNILDYAFQNYKKHTLVSKDDYINTLFVEKGLYPSVAVKSLKEIVLPLREDEIRQINTRVSMPQQMKAPVVGGSQIGKMEFVLDDKVIAETPLIIEKDVPHKDLKNYFFDILTNWGKLMKNPG